MTHPEQTPATSLDEQLNKTGEDQGILRNDGESDADYAERIVYELDLYVEELWACQDRVRELISKPDEAP